MHSPHITIRMVAHTSTSRCEIPDDLIIIIVLVNDGVIPRFSKSNRDT